MLITTLMQSLWSVMNAAVFKMLDDLGVEQENIAFDDFGG